MSSKSPKIAEWLRDCHHPNHSPHYVGFFRFFNQADYYEAHDVLEELWLEGGKAHPDYGFYKGLIQLAGGFVHMKWHHAHPNHRIHGKRLDPAARLLRLARANVIPYPGGHHALDTNAFAQLCSQYIERLEKEHYTRNPWNPEQLPKILPRDMGE